MSVNYVPVMAGGGGTSAINYYTGNGSITDLNKTKTGEEAAVIDIMSLITLDNMDIEGTSNTSAFDLIEDLTTALQRMDRAIKNIYSHMETTAKDMKTIDDDLSGWKKIEF